MVRMVLKFTKWYILLTEQSIRADTFKFYLKVTFGEKIRFFEVRVLEVRNVLLCTNRYIIIVWLSKGYRTLKMCMMVTLTLRRGAK